MFLKCLQAGPLLANCYILGDEKSGKAIVVDPGGDSADILAVVSGQGFKVEFIILTHGHIDHIGGVREIKKATGARIVIHEKDSQMLLSSRENLSEYLGRGITQPEADVKLKGGEKLMVGSLELEIIHTPGHTPGSICIKTGNLVFTGDTLFAGSVGRTDFPGGSYDELLNSIKYKLLTQADDTIIYPGHGIKTTIGQERDTNPFLR
jgi:glyoxylase-like metal-dependent hydrolase (beta-lactamase superfamily II)